MFTLSRIMAGFVVGGFGNLAGLAMGSSKLANAIIRPLFEVFRPIPAIAWIPMAILWFGVGEISKYFIVTFGCFVITALNAYAGAARTSPMFKGAARMLGADETSILQDRFAIFNPTNFLWSPDFHVSPAAQFWLQKWYVHKKAQVDHYPWNGYR